MKKLLSILYLFLFCSIGALQAQTVYVNIPDTVCMSTNNATADQLKFTSMNAMVEGSGVTVTQKATWSIASPGGTEADYEILYSDNTSTVKATKLTNTKSLTLQLLQPGDYTFTITLPYTKGGVNYVETRTVKMVAMDCTIRTCNGGNAVMPGFSENFGAMADGVSRRPYPVNGVVTYTYQGSGDLTDNNYTISNTTQGKSNWANVGDHTGDYRGAMLVANSAYQPSIFYQKTVTGLCKGSVYNFSAWLMNVNLENSFGGLCKSGYQYAGVTFRVVNAANQSQVLAEYRTYSVSMRLDQASLNSWQKYGGSFTVPANIDSVKVYIVNNKPGGCGNDIAVDDIEFSYCSPIITAGIDGNGSSLKEVLCEGAPVTLTSSYQPASYFVAPTYQWEMSDDNGITWINVPYGTATSKDLVIAPGELRGTRTVAADYLFRIRIYEAGSDVSTCAAPSSPVKLTILPMPTLYLTKSQVCAGTTVQLQASGGFDRYAWKDLPGYTGTTRDILVTEDTSITVYGFMDYGDGHTCMDENTKKILKVDAPAVELSSSSVSVCRTEQVELRVNAQLAGNTIRWFTGPDPVTGVRTPIAGTDDQTTISVQPMSVADSLYTVEVTDPTGTCVVTSAPYKVKVTEIPTAQVGANQVMCASFNESGSFTMDATLQPATTGRWTIQNVYGPGVSTTGTVNFDDYVMIANAANPRSRVILSPGVTAVLLWTVKSTENTNCTSSAVDTLSLLFDPTHSDAGPDTTQCGTNNIFTMVASQPNDTLTGPAAETGTWTLVSGNATIADIHAYNTTVTVNSQVDDIVLVWSITNAQGCTPTTDTVVIHKLAKPTITLKTPVLSCSQTGTFLLDTLATTGNPDTYSLAVGTGNPMPGFVTVTDQPLTWPLTISYPAGTAAGTYNFLLSYKNANAGCDSILNFTVDIETPPTAATDIIVSSPNICESGTTTLTVNGGNLGQKANGTPNAQWVWYAGGCGTGASIGTGTTITVSLNTTTTYYVRAEGTSPCDTTACVSTTVTVFEEPDPSEAGANVEHCMDPAFTVTGSTPSVGTGAWTMASGFGSGTAIIADPASQTTTVTIPNGDSAKLYWTITNGVCIVRDSVVLTNHQMPADANAGPDQAQCMTPLFTLAGSVPSIGTGTWTLLTGAGYGSGTATITTPNSNTSTVNVPNGDSAFLVWTITNGTCIAKADTVKLVNSQAPTTAAAGPDQANCNTADFTMAANTPTVGTGRWSLSSGNATIADPTNPSTTVTVAAGDFADLVWTITNGSCTSTDNVLLNNFQPPTSAAGADQANCMNATFTMNATVPTIGTGVWSLSTAPGSGNAIITNPNLATTTVTVAAGDSAYLVWTVTNGTCVATDIVILHNYLMPAAAVAGADQAQCLNTAGFTMTATAPTEAGAVGTWTIVSGTATITPGDEHKNNAVIQVPNGGTATLRWTITNGTCTAPTDDVQLTNYLTPADANAGPDQDQCNNTSFTLNGSTPDIAGAVGTWTVIAGTAVLNPADANTPNAPVTVAIGNTATLEWRISNATCTSKPDTVVLRSFAAPSAANAGADQDQCNNASFTLAGNTPAIGVGRWKLVLGNGVLLDTDTLLTNAPVTVAAGDTAVLEWTIINGTCTSSDRVVLRNFTQPAQASAGPDIAQCNNANFTMAGSTPSAGKGLWTVYSGTATIAPSTAAQPNATVTVAPGDTAVLYWTITNGPCTTVDSVILRNYMLPSAAAAGPDQNQCMTTSFTLAANTPAVGTGVWSVVQGAAVVTTLASPTSTVTVPNGDSATLVWTISNGSCTVTTDTVKLRNYLMPANANAGADQTNCDDVNFTMNATPVSPAYAIGTWTIISGSPTITDIHNPSTTVQVPAGTSATLQWTVTNGTCTSVPDQVTLTNQPAILGNTITADQVLCANQTPAMLQGGTVSGGNGTFTYQWQISTTSATLGFVNVATGGTNATYSPANIAQNTWYRRVVMSGGCTGNISNAVMLTLMNTPPVVISVPPAVTTDCVQGKDYTTLFGTPVFSHAPYTNEALTVTYNDVTTVVNTCTTTIMRTWTATDRCGLTTQAQQTITVVDRTAPVFSSAAPASVTVECNNVPAAVNLTAIDACNGTMTITPIEVRVDQPGACASNYQLIRKWVAVDACGNASDTLRQVVNVRDQTAPVFGATAPANITVDCDKVPAGAPLTATDNCTPGVITVNPVDTRKNISNSVCADNYQIIRTWTATDLCGNKTVLTQTITVQDTIRPVFSMTVPANVTVDCDKVPTVPAITATDNCTATIAVKVSEKKEFLSTTCLSSYRLTRTWTATDNCGNKNTMQQVILVQDTTRPTFTVVPPADTTVSCDAIPDAPVNISATDNCGSVKISYTQNRETVSGACAGNYRLVRTWTAKDNCNNTITARQVITVVDTTRPVIDPAPADVTLTCGQSIPVAATLYAKDNCDGTFPKKVTMTTDPYTVDACAGYTIIRRWNITDACGNAAIERVQTITVSPCPKPQLDPNMAANCSNYTKVAVLLLNKVSKPKFTLVSVVPAGIVSAPFTQSSNVFDLKGATQASFVVTDGVTGCMSDTVTYNLQYIAKPVVNLGNDTAICSVNSITLDAGTANAGYTIRWSTGETSQTITVSAAGTYKVTVSNGICSTSDSIKVSVNNPPVVNIPDAILCDGQTVKLNAYVQGGTYSWSTGETTAAIEVNMPGTYSVDVSLKGCTTHDDIDVTVVPAPQITLTDDVAICPGATTMLTVDPDGGTVRWSTNEATYSIVVSKEGTYGVTVTRGSCVIKDSVVVSLVPAPEVDLGPDREFCIGGRVTVDATTANAASYMWNDGTTNPVKEITAAGTYIVSVMDANCSRVVMDSMKVTVGGIPSTLLPEDTTLCIGRTLTLKPPVGDNSVRWQDGSNDDTYVVTTSGIYTVTVYNECGSVSDDITVMFKECEAKPIFPNAFTPNGDGKNDTFKPHVQGVMYDYDLRIYNRWGELIYLGKDAQTGWDGKFNGKLVENGTYVWLLYYKKKTGGETIIAKGEVSVLK